MSDEHIETLTAGDVVIADGAATITAATSRLFLTVARTHRHQRAGILAAYTWVGIDNAPTKRKRRVRLIVNGFRPFLQGTSRVAAR